MNTPPQNWKHAPASFWKHATRQEAQVIDKYGAETEDRTPDLLITNQLLYR